MSFITTTILTALVSVSPLSKPVHPCLELGFRPLQASEEAINIVMPFFVRHIAKRGWICSTKALSAECIKDRVADETRDVITQDKLETKYICIANDEATVFEVYYKKVDGVIEYRNKYPAIFGWPRKTSSKGTFAFVSKWPVSGQAIE